MGYVDGDNSCGFSQPQLSPPEVQYGQSDWIGQIQIPVRFDFPHKLSSAGSFSLGPGSFEYGEP